MRTITVEDFARWAVCEELPRSHAVLPMALAEGPRRVPRGSARALDYAAAVDLGARRDSLVNEFGVVAFDGATEPHPDAVAFYRAVLAIEADGDLRMDVPMSVFDGIVISAHRDIDGAREVAEARLSGALAVASLQASRTMPDGRAWPLRGCWGLVTYGATMRGFDCEAERLTLDFARKGGAARWFRRVERDVLGQIETLEVEGLDPKRRIPYPDAYRRVDLTPDPTDALASRIEWFAWRAVLAEAARRLDGCLTDHVLIFAGNDDLPWMRAPVRVLESVAAARVTEKKKKGRRTA